MTLQRTCASKDIRIKGLLPDSVCCTTTSMMRLIFLSSLEFYFIGGQRFQGQRVDMKRQENELDGDA